MRSEGYCSWVCLSVCLLSHISPMERLFVLKTRSRTQRATKVKKFVGFSLKPLRCRDPALPPLYGHAYSRPFFHAYFSCTRMRNSAHAYFSCIYAHDTPPRVQHFSAFHLCCFRCLQSSDALVKCHLSAQSRWSELLFSVIHFLCFSVQKYYSVFSFQSLQSLGLTHVLNMYLTGVGVASPQSMQGLSRFQYEAAWRCATWEDHSTRSAKRKVQYTCSTLLYVPIVCTLSRITSTSSCFL